MTLSSVFGSSAPEGLWGMTVTSAYAAGRAGATKPFGRARWYALAGVGLSILAFDQSARAADANTSITSPSGQITFDWSGFYIGAHAGFGRGSSNAVLTDPIASATSKTSQKLSLKTTERLVKFCTAPKINPAIPRKPEAC